MRVSSPAVQRLIGPKVEPNSTEFLAAEPSLTPQKKQHSSLAPQLAGQTAGLLLVVLAVKVWLLPFPVSHVGEFLRYLLRLAIVSAPDLQFVAVLFSGWCVLVPWMSKHRANRRWGKFGIGASLAACALYAVASVEIYRWMMVPLTIQLLSFSGGPGLMSSSAVGCLTPGVLAALAWSLLTVWAAPWCCAWGLGWDRWQAVARWATSGRWAMAWLGMTLVGASVCSAYVERNWTDPNRWERRIAQSPHAVLLWSVAEECFKSESLALSYSSAAADLSDFSPPVANLPSGNRPQPDFQTAARPKNVFILVLESVGAPYMSLYGSPHQTTPHLQRLADERGVVFDQFYVHSPSSCKSLIPLTAGVYPRIDWRLTVRDCPQFDVPTMAQVLGKQGYRNCFLHAGYWSWKHRDQYLTARGADLLIDADRLAEWKVNSWGVSDRVMLEAALRWIDEKPGQPFQALAWTIETHHPYVVTGEEHEFGVKDRELNRYLNAVRAADEQIAWLVEELDKRGLSDSTLLVITGDHGELFGQHSQRVHNFGVYEESIQVPLIMLHPSLRHLPKRQTEVRQQIDLLPTILEMLGHQPPAAWQGVSLWQQNPMPRVYSFALGNQAILGLRDGPYKYHFHVANGQEELYNLSLDPRELHNISADHPDLCRQYQTRLNGLVEHQRAFHAAHGAP